MDDNVKKELEVYENILKRWMASDLAYALSKGGGDWGYLGKDMSEKFWDWMFPALHRLYEVGHTDEVEFKEFIGKMINYVNTFNEVIESLGEEEDSE